jgi:mitochondrial fission protein ELM1
MKSKPVCSSSAVLGKRFTLIDNERRFRRACEQIVQLNHKLDALQSRYLKAKRDNMKTNRYNLRLRLAVAEGLRNMYYDYAHQKAEAVAKLREEMYGETVEILED